MLSILCYEKQENGISFFCGNFKVNWIKLKGQPPEWDKSCKNSKLNEDFYKKNYPCNSVKRECSLRVTINLISYESVWWPLVIWQVYLAPSLCETSARMIEFLVMVCWYPVALNGSVPLNHFTEGFGLPVHFRYLCDPFFYRTLDILNITALYIFGDVCVPLGLQ